MKIKSLSRSCESSVRQNSGDLKKLTRTLDPKYKPLERAREYTRALTAAKLERMFAKPFVDALEGHVDAISCTASSRGHLCPFLSGGVDGEVRVWDLASRNAVWSCKTAHAGWVRGICVDNKGDSFFTAGDDKTIKQWGLGVSNLGGRKEKKVKKVKQEKMKEDKSMSKDKSRKEKGKYDDDDDDESSSSSSSSSSESESVSESESEDEEEVSPNIKNAAPSYGNNSNLPPAPKPINSWLYSHTLKSMDHHWREESFATSSDESVELWSHHRSAPLQVYKLWGDDSVNVVRYNPSERSLLAHCSSDRGIGLHDTRSNTGLKKCIMSMRANCLEWNPMEPMNFVVGNEDSNCYSFDMRKLSTPTYIHKGHVAAVLSVGWSSTGREFVSGSYDRTVRIFGHREGTSRDCYYTKRMQRVFTVNYTADAKFVVSGSDDTNLRIWKARSNEKVGQTLVREEKAMEYRNSLIKKFKHMPDVKKITNSRHLPKFIKNANNQKQVIKESKAKKMDNRVKHSKKGTVEYEGERQKTVIKEVE